MKVFGQHNIQVSYMPASFRRFIPRHKWSDVSDDNLVDYGGMLDHPLSSMSIPWEAMQCDNTPCMDHDGHCHSVQIFHDTVMDKMYYCQRFVYYHTDLKCPVTMLILAGGMML